MKAPKSLHISEKDYVTASRRASRQAEIALHGKQISFRTMMHKSLKKYSRKRAKALMNKLDL